MIYKVYTTNGERFTFDIDRFTNDGSGTTLIKDGLGTVAFFYPGQVAQIFIEEAQEEAEVVTRKTKSTKKQV